MINLLGEIRRSRLLGGPYSSQGEMGIGPAPRVQIPQEPTPFGLPDYETPALESYKRHIDTMPQRQDYKNPVIQKILAGIAGFSTLDANAAYGTTRGILDDPYNRAIGDYKLKGNQLGELADIEATDVNTKYKQAIAEANQRRADTAEGRLGATAASTIERNDAYIKNLQETAKTRGKVLRNNAITGELEFVDMRTGQRESVGKFAPSEAEKRTNALGDYKQRTDYGAGVSRQTYRSNADYGDTLGRANAEYRADLGEESHATNRDYDVAHPMPSTARPPAPVVLMPSQQANARKLAIERALTIRPDWAKFMVNGIPTNKTAGWMGASQAQYDQDFKDFTKAMGDEEKKIIAETKSARAPIVPSNAPENAPEVLDPTEAETTQEDATSELADEEDGEFEFDDGSKWQKVNGIVTKLE